MTINDLSNEQKVLIHKTVKEDVFKAAAKMLGQGKYVASAIMRVSGEFKIGAPYEQAIMLTFPWQKLALRLATRVSRHVLDAVLREIRETPLEDEELKEHVKVFWADVNKDAMKECAGKVTGSPNIEVARFDPGTSKFLGFSK